MRRRCREGKRPGCSGLFSYAAAGVPEKPAMRKPGGRLPCGGGGHGRKHLSGAGLRCSGAAGIGGRELPGGISPRGVRGREKRMVMPGKGLPPWGAVTGARRNFGAERIFRKGEGAFACAEPFADRGEKRVAVREGLEKGKNAPGLPCAAGRGAGLRVRAGESHAGRTGRKRGAAEGLAGRGGTSPGKPALRAAAPAGRGRLHAGRLCGSGARAFPA